MPGRLCRSRRGPRARPYDLRREAIRPVTAPDDYALLAWEDVLPVAFSPGAYETDARLVAHRVAGNLRVLHTCEALEERRAERDEELAGAPEAARLEQKIDLLIELVGHWVSQSGARPPAVVASLSAARLVWRTAGIAPPVGTVGTAEVYPREGVAEAVRLPGEVVSHGPDGRISFVFGGLSEAEVDALERFVFRQHRRKIAGRRRGG